MKPALRKYLSHALRSLTVIVLIFFFSGTSAQRVLLSKNVAGDTLKSHFGQNLRHFVHPYLGLGMMAGPSEPGGDILYFVSPNFEAGIRYKLRITRHIAVGCDLAYDLYSYKLKQTDTKILPDTLQHKAERMLFSNLALGFYFRINLGRTGNYIGKFIDIGAFGDWTHYADHYTRDKFSDGTTSVSYTHLTLPTN
jgi:hypothetical protein